MVVNHPPLQAITLLRQRQELLHLGDRGPEEKQACETLAQAYATTCEAMLLSALKSEKLTKAAQRRSMQDTFEKFKQHSKFCDVDVQSLAKAEVCSECSQWLLHS